MSGCVYCARAGGTYSMSCRGCRNRMRENARGSTVAELRAEIACEPYEQASDVENVSPFDLDPLAGKPDPAQQESLW